MARASGIRVGSRLVRNPMKAQTPTLRRSKLVLKERSSATSRQTPGLCTFLDLWNSAAAFLAGFVLFKEVHFSEGGVCVCVG